MPTPQPGIFSTMMRYQWFLHLSRVEGADLNAIKKAIADTRRASASAGAQCVVSFGPRFLPDLTNDVPEDFQPYPTYESIDGSGRQARGTQEEMLLWYNHDDKGLIWKLQWDARQALKGHMNVARETPTFVYGASLDMTGFIDGTGNPEPERQRQVAAVADGQPGAGGSHVIAQRWIHDLEAWEKLPVQKQEENFGRTKRDSKHLDNLAPQSHLAHVELVEGGVGAPGKPKRDEIVRRSTPYAFHDGSVGLYFFAFCKTQAPFRERMERMYGRNGEPRDMLTDFSNPASGSYYFAPSVEMLDSLG